VNDTRGGRKAIDEVPAVDHLSHDKEPKSKNGKEEIDTRLINTRC
jgi:hypothetical protein